MSFLDKPDMNERVQARIQREMSRKDKFAGRLTEGDLLYVRSLESAVEILRNELSKYQASDEMLSECCSDLDRVKAERDAHIHNYEYMAKRCAEQQVEIERLKAELAAETQRRWDGNRIASDEAAADFNEMRDMAVKEMARWAREAGASQAREAKLLGLIQELDTNYDHRYEVQTIITQALDLPSDDTALQEAIKQGQREAAEHILEMWRDPWPRAPHRFIDRLETYVEELK